MTPEQRERAIEALEPHLFYEGVVDAGRVFDQVIAPLLTAARREGAEQAWDEGYIAAVRDGGIGVIQSKPNPYRADKIAAIRRLPVYEHPLSGMRYVQADALRAVLGPDASSDKIAKGDGE